MTKYVTRTLKIYPTDRPSVAPFMSHIAEDTVNW